MHCCLNKLYSKAAIPLARHPLSTHKPLSSLCRNFTPCSIVTLLKLGPNHFRNADFQQYWWTFTLTKLSPRFILYQTEHEAQFYWLYISFSKQNIEVSITKFFRVPQPFSLSSFSAILFLSLLQPLTSLSSGRHPRPSHWSTSSSNQISCQEILQEQFITLQYKWKPVWTYFGVPCILTLVSCYHMKGLGT